MDKLTDKLLELKELLEKSMNNVGTGGAGSVKAGAVLPSINKLPKPGNASVAGKVKIPGQTSASKKNPLDVAQQTHNKDIKDIRMKEAHAQIVMQKAEDLYHIHENGMKITSEPMTLKDIHEKHGGVQKLESNGYRVIQHKPEEVKIAKNGQWSLDKSNYPGGYSPEDNAKRKANNTGEKSGIHSMDSIKRYGGSGPNAADKEAKEMRAKSKKNPVKVYTPEEIAALNNPTEKTEGRTTAVPGVSEMGIEARRSNPKSQSYARIVSPEKHSETAKDIARANIKQTQSIKPNLPK